MKKQLILFIVETLTGKHVTSVSFLPGDTARSLEPAKQIIKKSWDEFLFSKNTVKFFDIAFDEYLSAGYPDYFRRVPKSETEFKSFCTVLVAGPVDA